MALTNTGRGYLTLVNRTVQPVHFEDFGGHQFERLVFAFLLRTDSWLSLEWYGQAGADSGIDIWGVRETDGYPRGQKVCIQCANVRTMPLSKVREDLDKVLVGPNGKPDVFVVVCGGKVSARVRDKAKELFEQKRIHDNAIWSGNEFEERLRAGAEAGALCLKVTSASVHLCVKPSLSPSLF